MLSENLTKYRKKKNYSKLELERKSGISHRTIEFIEYGKITSPRLQTLKKLAKALDVTVNELIN